MFKSLSVRRREQGFSLPEMMVGLAIIVIVAAIAVPSFLNQRKTNVDSQTRTALEDVISRIEGHLVRSPGAAIVVTKHAGGRIEIRVGTTIEDYNTSSTTLDIRASTGAGGSYRLAAWDTRGKKYISGASSIKYESVNKAFSVGPFSP